MMIMIRMMMKVFRSCCQCFFSLSLLSSFFSGLNSRIESPPPLMFNDQERDKWITDRPTGKEIIIKKFTVSHFEKPPAADDDDDDDRECFLHSVIFFGKHTFFINFQFPCIKIGYFFKKKTSKFQCQPEKMFKQN